MIAEKIFSVVSYYLAFYFEYVNLCSLTNNKHKFSIKNFLIILLISAINYVSTISGAITLKMIISFLSLLIISKFLVKLSLRESLVASLIYYLMILFIEYIFAIVLIDVLKYDPSKYLPSVGVQKCIIGHIINLINFITCKIKIFKKAYQLMVYIIDKIGIKNNHIYLFLLSIFIIQMMYIINIAGKIKTIYTILYIIIFIIFITYIIVSIYKNYYLITLNKFLIEKDNDMQKIVDEYKLFKHNIKNDLLAISSISSKKVKEMINDYMQSYNLGISSNSNITSMPNGLRGVIYQKIISQKKLNASIIVDNYIKNDPMNVLPIKDYRTLVESFGIIIDNALEAITLSEKDYIYIFLSEKSDLYKIICVNNFSNNIDIDKQIEKGVSSKKGHSGIGLYYIKNKTKCDLKTRIVNNKYICELVINK